MRNAWVLRFEALGAAMPLLLAAGCSSGAPQDLRGPAPQVGQVYRQEGKMTISNGTMIFTEWGVPQTARLDLIGYEVFEEEILAVVDRRVTKSRTRIFAERQKVTTRARGQTDIHTEPYPLEGETVLSERVGDAWKTTLEGKAPSPKQQAELKVFEPRYWSVDCYPVEPVSPGHRWTIEGQELRSLRGGGFQVDEGRLRMTFDRTVEMDGEPCAQVGQDWDVRGKMRGEGDSWLQMELQATGTSLRSLKRGFTLGGKLTGTLRLSGTVLDVGRQVQLKIDGPVTIETRVQVEACGELPPDALAKLDFTLPPRPYPGILSWVRWEWAIVTILAVSILAVAGWKIGMAIGRVKSQARDANLLRPFVKLGADGKAGIMYRE
jgi:hypothetical protein